MNKLAALRIVEAEVKELTNGELVRLRRDSNYIPVFGAGSPDASIIFIGEAPGEKEAKSGLPFVGRSGKLLTELLELIDVTREEVYITSIVKDRPPKNRDPKPIEIEQYAPFLDRQIEIIQPKVIATLGRFSMEYIMRRYGLEEKIAPISALHGQVLTAHMSYGDVLFVPLFHPAAAIYNQKLKETLMKDFKVLQTVIS